MFRSHRPDSTLASVRIPTGTQRKLRPTRRGGVAIAGLLIVALGASGCGSGSTGATTTKSTPVAAITKAEFVAKANVICGGADPVLSEAAAKLASHPTRAQVAAIVHGTYVPSVEAQISGIRALGTPAGEQAAVAGMLKLVQIDLSKLKRNPMLVTTDVFGNFAKVAHPYGLTACAPLS
jgi:hypothetical protein